MRSVSSLLKTKLNACGLFEEYVKLVLMTGKIDPIIKHENGVIYVADFVYGARVKKLLREIKEMGIEESDVIDENDWKEYLIGVILPEAQRRRNEDS